MDGERLAGGRKLPGSAAQGRVCHAAGIYQRAAHRAHPGGGAQGRRDGLYPLLQVRKRACTGGNRVPHRQETV